MSVKEIALASAHGTRVVWLGRVAFAPALALQESLLQAKLRDPHRVPDTLLLLEHDPVYTIGRTQDRSSLGKDAQLPYPIETIHSGGQATYHGPGQLVGYAIVDLGRRARDLHRYLRVLEELLLQTLASYGVPGARRPELTGIWVGGRKIASIGVGVRRWITMHGFALNVVASEALPPFQAIIPCGIQGVQMTALDQVCTGQPGVEHTAHTLAPRFAPLLEELQASGQSQNDQNDENQAQTAAGIVAPTGAVRPGR